MKTPKIENIPWKGGPEFYHLLLQGEESTFCLYSGGRGRFSYVGFQPKAHIRVFPDRVEFLPEDRNARLFSENPFSVLNSFLKFHGVPPSPFFASGWVGFVNYEMGGWADPRFPRRILSPQTLMGGWALYDPLLVFDHVEERAWVSSWGIAEDFTSNQKLAEERVRLVVSFLCRKEIPLAPSFVKRGEKEEAPFEKNLKSNFSQEEYLSAVERILGYLEAGDCYQVNLSQKFSFDLVPSQKFPELFWHLAKSHPAPFSAFLDWGDKKILSLSPEEFLSLRGNQIQTRPIKGTRRRSQDPHEDRKIVGELLSSAKDQAELLMIVDLERNDLGKICRTGSVSVPALKQMESFDYVHHLTATVRGELRDGIGVGETLQALFPGGSITGAPKRRAMEIIQELEDVPRGVYTGVIGFVDYSPLAVFSIAIRTLEAEGARACFGAGGGIVADSDPKAEYEETITKAKVFLGESASPPTAF